ncbi:MAG: hypothetical protein ACRD3O_20850 [Terriglobia bacterium]
MRELKERLLSHTQEPPGSPVTRGDGAISQAQRLVELALEMRDRVTPAPRVSDQRTKKIFTSTLQLPFRARWSTCVLSPGKYHVILVESASAHVVAIHGTNVAAMLTPDHVSALQGTHLSTLFLMPATPLARVQLLRLASAQIDLHFRDAAPNNSSPTILALPLSENGVYESA